MITLGTYLTLLCVLFLVVPAAIVAVRRLRLAEACAARHAGRLERLKALVLQNRELSKRSLSQQLEAYLYAQVRGAWCAARNTRTRQRVATGTRWRRSSIRDRCSCRVRSPRELVRRGWRAPTPAHARSLCAACTPSPLPRQTNIGYTLDAVQAVLSLLSVFLFIAASYLPPNSGARALCVRACATVCAACERADARPPGSFARVLELPLRHRRSRPPRARAHSPRSRTHAHTRAEADPLAFTVMEALLSLYFLFDFALRMYLARDR